MKNVKNNDRWANSTNDILLHFRKSKKKTPKSKYFQGKSAQNLYSFCNFGIKGGPKV